MDKFYFRLQYILVICLATLAACSQSSQTKPKIDFIPQNTAKQEIANNDNLLIQNSFIQNSIDGNKKQLKQDIIITESNLWDRMTDGFKLNACHDKKGKQWSSYYASKQKLLKRIFKRAEPWLYYIVEETEKRNLPLEFALLPAIESAFNPYAYSRSKAAGTWQFMSGTARDYGLDINWWYDGRRDVYAATPAALNYLQNLSKEFNQDWLLALAAYNSGENRVKRAIRKNQRSRRSTDFSHLKLPRETKNYVPKLLGFSCLIENPEKFNITLPLLNNTPTFKAIALEKQMTLDMVAKLGEIDLHTFYRYNPGFNRGITTPNKNHHIVLPIDNANLFTTNVLNFDHSQHSTWARYQVEKGDTLSDIAAKNNVTVLALQQANNMHRSTKIIAGKHLLIPTSGKSYNPFINFSSNSPIKHTVTAGESLWSIAKKHKVTINNIAKWNNLIANNLLPIGKELTILKSQSGENPINHTAKIHYTVKKGDSLWKIAKKFNVRTLEIQRWNNLGKTNLLKPGQNLILNVNVTQQASNF